MADEWFSPQRAAEFLGVAPSTLRGYIRGGLLPARRIRGSRLLRIARADLEALLEPMAQKTAPRLSVIGSGRGR